MSADYATELAVALDAVREASELCRTVQRGITAEVLAKKDRSPVTVADFGSQALICRRLHESFPHDPVTAEEDAAELIHPEYAAVLQRVVQEVSRIRPEAGAELVCDWINHGCARGYVDRFWTLDPIDGTKGFLRREQYAISLALIVRGRIEVAVLGCPNLQASQRESSGRLGSLMFATRGGGAWQVGFEKESARQRVSVSKESEPVRARFCESVESGHSSHHDAAAVADRLGIQGKPVRMDSQAKYAVVARGEAEIYLRLPTRADYREKIWDHAGGVLVVTEAGGTVTDVAGKPLEFTHGPELVHNRGVVVTNGPLHMPVLSALATALG
jgi:3'(2'), 5'-bisphosphate nucleotidase